jgi:elongation factor P
MSSFRTRGSGTANRGRAHGGRPSLVGEGRHRVVRGRLRVPLDLAAAPTSKEQVLTRMATTNDLKNGMVLNLDGQLWSVIWFQHHKPGKGGAVVRTKLKNIESGKTVDKTFNADVKVEVANVDKRTMQYLYNDGTSYVFMDVSTYDQIEVAPEIVGDAQNFLLENQEAIVATNEGRVLYIELPASVELLVEYTEPGLQGDRSTGGTKPARLETGHEINVPLFITTGEKIKVDTRDSSYLGRVSS